MKMAHFCIESASLLGSIFARYTSSSGKFFNHFREVSTCIVRQQADQQTLVKSAAAVQTSYGQPFSSTHPHLVKDGEVTPGLTTDEYCGRRLRLMQSLAQQPHAEHARHHVLVVPAARLSYLSEDIPHPFRQNTDLLYLSGCLEPDAVLVLHSVDSRAPPHHTSALFLQRNTAYRQLWEGGGTGPEAAPRLLGVDRAHGLAELPRYLECLAAELAGATAVWYDLGRDPHSPLSSTVHDLVSSLRGAVLESPRCAIQQLRLMKSPAEQRLMRRSARCAAAAICDAMAASRPGVSEHELQARVDFGARLRGAERLAYPPVVAGGARTNVIHYTHNNQTVREGELLLMDAGCELHGYSSDISRTWPIGGQFSGEQRLLYQTLLEVQEELIELVGRTRPSLDALYGHMFRLLSERLAELGLVGFNRERSQLFRSVQRFCPHHVGHYLGMDVHDTSLMPKNLPLQPGMVITVEPGLYVGADDLGCPEGFRGLGFRIEDDVLITEDGCEVLSADCPKTVAGLERAVGADSAANAFQGSG